MPREKKKSTRIFLPDRAMQRDRKNRLVNTRKKKFCKGICLNKVTFFGSFRKKKEGSQFLTLFLSFFLSLSHLSLSADLINAQKLRRFKTKKSLQIRTKFHSFSLSCLRVLKQLHFLSIEKLEEVKNREKKFYVKTPHTTEIEQGFGKENNFF